MINNISPFSKILDNYQNESFYLSAVLKSLKAYPDIYNDDYIDEEGLLYATSFALLCERFIYYTTGNEGNYLDDFDALHYELEFETPANNLENKLIEYREKIVIDLKEILNTEENIISFFGSIFNMEKEEGYIVDYSKAQDFYHEYF